MATATTCFLGGSVHRLLPGIAGGALLEAMDDVLKQPPPAVASRLKAGMPQVSSSPCTAELPVEVCIKSLSDVSLVMTLLMIAILLLTAVAMPLENLGCRCRSSATPHSSFLSGFVSILDAWM